MVRRGSRPWEAAWWPSGSWLVFFFHGRGGRRRRQGPWPPLGIFVGPWGAVELVFVAPCFAAEYCPCLGLWWPVAPAVSGTAGPRPRALSLPYGLAICAGALWLALARGGHRNEACSKRLRCRTRFGSRRSSPCFCRCFCCWCSRWWSWARPGTPSRCWSTPAATAPRMASLLNPGDITDTDVETHVQTLLTTGRFPRSLFTVTTTGAEVHLRHPGYGAGGQHLSNCPCWGP